MPSKAFNCVKSINRNIVIYSFRPIFIVHTVLDSEGDNDVKNGIDKSDSCLINERVDMEINNNNSFYLHECEDKGDNNDKKMQCKNNFSQSVKAAKSGFSRKKLVENSIKDIIDIVTMSLSEKDPSNDGNDESSQLKNEIVTPSSGIKIPDEVDNENSGIEMIRSDSERLENNCDDEGDSVGITTSEKSLTDVEVAEVTWVEGES